MLLLHGGWTAGKLVIWAEDTARTAPAAPPLDSSPQPHPFAADPLTLRTTLDDLLRTERAERPATAEPTTAETPAAELPVVLPGSARGGPLPSPESGLPAPPHGRRLAAYTVPAVLMAPDQALDLLALVWGAGEESEAPPFKPAASLRYLAVVADAARSLARRGRVLPQLVAEGTGHAARWVPVLTGADATAFAELAAAMPPVCRAANTNGEATGKEHEEQQTTTDAGHRTQPAIDASDTLREVLGGLVDAAVRRRLPERLLVGQRPGLKAPLPDRWLLALTGDDAELPQAKPKDAERLDGALRKWLEAAHELDGPWRVHFHLVEPVDDDVWRVEFALQSAEDSELLMPAERIWAGEREAWSPERPEAELEAGLRRAVRLWPDLHTALRAPRPTSLMVETAWAFRFLRNAAPLLRAAGYGVRLPAWAGRQGLGLRLRAAGGAEGSFGLDTRLDFRMDLAIGDHTITEEELDELARLKIPLARVRGQWVELDDRQLKAALRVVERGRDGSTTVGELIRQVVEGGEVDLPLVGVDAEGPLGALLSGQADRRLTPVPTPADFQGSLRPYQERGLSWLSFLSGLGLGGILADDMGLGKTAQTLALMLDERVPRDGGAPPGPTLLICPMSLVGNWHREAGRFAPSLRVYIHHGGGRTRGAEFDAAAGEADLVVTTYGTALRDLDMLAGVVWGRVVCDEAQAIKNSAARQARAVRAIPARSRLALTGTPVENHLAELWSIMEFCNPGLLGSAQRFRERYQVPIEVRGDDEAARALRQATGPFVLRRLKTDKSIISDLPEKLEMKVWCTLTPEQAELYKAVADEMMGRIEGSRGIERRGNIMAAMTRLKQICNHPAHMLKDGSRLTGRSGKLARLEELAEEIMEEGEKVLVFTQYAEFGTMLQPYLAMRLDRPVLWLHGGLSKRRRDELIERFQNDPEPMVFLLSLKAAGTGLNLTAASHVIHVDRWWNPAVEDQATDRAFRIGQTKNVQVRKFICVGTLEERIDEMVERKKALADRVVGTGEEWITDLSTEQLRELFRLDPEAVSG
ncbi:DEAD/DEAH box helicase [Sinosporangium siamense]|uniref:Helicase HelZ n=1 Tax=Sinosporangium siamense TaxID=1367973 RepID=A0A919RF12_9ACTN|nr:DEAD/DEAH box helicase [Sinosporangium siamense]GII91214.1 helicase HelZ [Sinosporangium siamense]